MRCFKKLLVCSLAVAALYSLQSCSQSDDLEVSSAADVNLPLAISQDFDKTFPGATSVDWSVDSIYATASFSFSNEAGELIKSTVLYNLTSQQRSLLSTNSNYDALPDAVKAAFESSDYAAWQLTLVSQISRYSHKAVSAIYVIKAQGTFADDSTLFDVTLYYTAEGLLVHLDLDAVRQNSHHGYGDWVVDNIPDYVIAFVDSNYPGARYIHIEVGNDGAVVEILDQRTVRTLYFDAAGNWTSTRTNVNEKNLPAEVRNAIDALEADHAKVSEIEECVTAEGETYYIATVKGKDGKKSEVRINVDGTTPDSEPADGDDNNPEIVDNGLLQNRTQVEAYILNRYPEATIRDWDQDNKQLVVEIVYTGVKIDVTFERSAEGYAWSSSEWDLDYRQPESLPEAVKAAVEASYADYQLYFASFVETADEGNYYLVGLKSGRSSIKVKLDEQGNVLAEYGK
ncbi:MAG: PepSY-like domain-containing protein [Candidatus Limisoma sp.]